jgi:hypothetical protein
MMKNKKGSEIFPISFRSERTVLKRTKLLFGLCRGEKPKKKQISVPEVQFFEITDKID